MPSMGFDTQDFLNLTLTTMFLLLPEGTIFGQEGGALSYQQMLASLASINCMGASLSNIQSKSSNFTQETAAFLDGLLV